jgi:hypothetical protein
VIISGNEGFAAKKKENIDNPAYVGLLDVFRRGEKIVLL